MATSSSSLILVTLPGHQQVSILSCLVEVSYSMYSMYSMDGGGEAILHSLLVFFNRL